MIEFLRNLWTKESALRAALIGAAVAILGASADLPTWKVIVVALLGALGGGVTAGTTAGQVVDIVKKNGFHVLLALLIPAFAYAGWQQVAVIDGAVGERAFGQAVELIPRDGQAPLVAVNVMAGVSQVGIYDGTALVAIARPTTDWSRPTFGGDLLWLGGRLLALVGQYNQPSYLIPISTTTSRFWSLAEVQAAAMASYPWGQYEKLTYVNYGAGRSPATNGDFNGDGVNDVAYAYVLAGGATTGKHGVRVFSGADPQAVTWYALGLLKTTTTASAATAGWVFMGAPAYAVDGRANAGAVLAVPLSRASGQRATEADVIARGGRDDQLGAQGCQMDADAGWFVVGNPNANGRRGRVTLYRYVE